MFDLDDLLLKTSRTFALAIPLLEEPTRQSVGLTYLLFRIADTFEDAALWPRQKRISALEEFAHLLKATDVDAVRAKTKEWLQERPLDHEGYLELLNQTADVVAAVKALKPSSKAFAIHHAVRTALGMADIVRRGDELGNLRLHSVQDLKDYCYVVAGIVGEFLTDVFLDDAPSLRSVEKTLRQNQVKFGEALQLVNILKDSKDDAKEGRVYLPANTPREQVIALAKEDLAASVTYVAALQKGQAPKGILAFTALPLMLAQASVRELETKGPGAKVSRREVTEIMASLSEKIESGSDLESLASL